MLEDCLGYAVRGSDGRVVGTVVRCGPRALVVGTGRIFRRSVQLSTREVVGVGAHELYVSRPSQFYARA